MTPSTEAAEERKRKARENFPSHRYVPCSGNTGTRLPAGPGGSKWKGASWNRRPGRGSAKKPQTPGREEGKGQPQPGLAQRRFVNEMWSKTQFLFISSTSVAQLRLKRRMNPLAATLPGRARQPGAGESRPEAFSHFSWRLASLSPRCPPAAQQQDCFRLQDPSQGISKAHSEEEPLVLGERSAPCRGAVRARIIYYCFKKVPFLDVGARGWLQGASRPAPTRSFKTERQALCCCIFSPAKSSPESSWSSRGWGSQTKEV